MCQGLVFSSYKHSSALFVIVHYCQQQKRVFLLVVCGRLREQGRSWPLALCPAALSHSGGQPPAPGSVSTSAGSAKVLGPSLLQQYALRSVLRQPGQACTLGPVLAQPCSSNCLQTLHGSSKQSTHRLFAHSSFPYFIIYLTPSK